MRPGPGTPPFAWGALLAVNAAVLALWPSSRWWAALPLAVTAVAALTLGVALRLRRPAEEPARLIPDSSAATAVLVPGIALVALAAAAGLWLGLLGAGLCLLGLAGLVRERRASRRQRA